VGVLQRFERRIEGAVNGAFAKAFKSEVQPVEIASALQRECDDRAAIVGPDRTMVPNDFTVELGSHDYDRLLTYETALTTELPVLISDYGQEQRYLFVGPVKVRFERTPDLATGMFRIRSQALAGPGGAPGGMPGGAPGYPPQPPPGMGGGYPPPVAPAPYQQPGGFQPPPPQPAYAQPGGFQPPQPAAPQFWLEINGVRHPLSQTVTTMGRGTDVDLRIDDPSVSRRHAEIRLGTPSYVSDLGSTNGIVVDNQHVPQAQLRNGSVIHLGNTTIIFRTGER
jgi:hypothetical protein